jgi:hypothetical protein
MRTRNGGQLHVDTWPDKVERNRPAPDLLAHDEVGNIVVEHTTVVAYTDQVEDNVRARDVLSGGSLGDPSRLAGWSSPRQRKATSS